MESTHQRPDISGSNSIPGDSWTKNPLSPDPIKIFKDGFDPSAYNPDLHFIPIGKNCVDSSSLHKSKVILENFKNALSSNTVVEELTVEEPKPLYKITGLDENGYVKLETGNPIEIKKGKTKIVVDKEKLSKVLNESYSIDTKSVEMFKKWVKQNVYRVGSLKKVDDVDWNNLIDKMSKNLGKKNISYILNEDRPTEEPNVTKIEMPPSVNRNAYELRQIILQDAISVVMKKVADTESLDEVVNKIMKVSATFYQFVENRK